MFASGFAIKTYDEEDALPHNSPPDTIHPLTKPYINDILIHNKGESDLCQRNPLRCKARSNRQINVISRTAMDNTLDRAIEKLQHLREEINNSENKSDFKLLAKLLSIIGAFIIE